MNFPLVAFSETVDIAALISACATTLAFVFGGIFYCVDWRKDRARDRKTANSALYQTLELASIELFRFEADHPKVIAPLWEKDAPLPVEGTAEFVAAMNYLCQNLNLFEMAIRFYRNGVFENDIFRSWQTWVFAVAHAPGFPRLWKAVENDYVQILQNVMNTAHEAASLDAFKDEIQKMFAPKTKRKLDCCKQRACCCKNNAAPNITFQWATDKNQAAACAAFFCANVNQSYISHSEVLCGRAIDAHTWSPNLQQIVTNEIASASPATLETGKGKAVLTAWDKNICVGLLIVSADTGPTGIPYATLDDIVVDKNYRHAHIAQRMCQMAEETLKRLHITQFLLESGKDNAAAHHALERLGFAQISISMMKRL